MNNHSFYKLFARDFTYSISYGKYKYSVFYGIIAILSLFTSLQLQEFGSNGAGTIYELLKDNGYIMQLSDYRVPVHWVFTQFFVLFLIGDFLFQDLETSRTYLLLRSHSKVAYMLSKLCWIIVQNILIFLGIFVVIYVVSGMTYGDFSLSSSNFYENAIASRMDVQINPIELISRMFLGYMMTSILLSGIMLLCIQFISPIVTFFAVIFVSAISTFSDLKWLPAIHSMVRKQAVFDWEHHLTLGFSVTYSFALFSVIAVITIVVFRKKDIL